jgi:hypothetical protein
VEIPFSDKSEFICRNELITNNLTGISVLMRNVKKGTKKKQEGHQGFEVLRAANVLSVV